MRAKGGAPGIAFCLADAWMAAMELALFLPQPVALKLLQHPVKDNLTDPELLRAFFTAE